MSTDTREAPATTGRPEGPPAAGESSPGRGRGATEREAPIRVLLVEDNDDHAELIADALERCGAARFTVRRVASGAEALAAAVPGAYDTLLLDYGLGDMDGVSLLARLRAAGTETPAIVLTSHGSELVAVRALRAQADDYLPKAEALVGDRVARTVLGAVERRRLADQLAWAREEAAAAEAATQARDAFLAAASHDLKNPLTTIRGTAQLLSRQVGRGGLPPADQLLAALATIEQATAQMAAQIDELLDVARMRLGHALELECRPTDLVALAERTIAAHAPAAEGHELRLVADEPSLVGAWDEPRLERVLANLLGNAVKYSPHGGAITIRLERERGRTTSPASGEAAGGTADPDSARSGSAGAEEWAMLAVSDQGVGIPEQDLPYIFEQFRRSENVIGRIAGTGIGLAIVRQIVEQHGGAVAVESREGSGSTFTIRLPLPARPEQDERDAR